MSFINSGKWKFTPYLVDETTLAGIEIDVKFSSSRIGGRRNSTITKLVRCQ
jgi:hypothetical protein